MIISYRDVPKGVVFEFRSPLRLLRTNNNYNSNHLLCSLTIFNILVYYGLCTMLNSYCLIDDIFKHLQVYE